MDSRLPLFAATVDKYMHLASNDVLQYNNSISSQVFTNDNIQLMFKRCGCQEKP